MNEKRVKYRFLTGLLLAVLVAGAFAVGRLTVDRQSANEQSTETHRAEREILYWQAPMNPSEIYDKPGKSAMGMDLVPVYADEAANQGGSAEREILYWQAPMNPSEIYDKPGKSAMGMDLVPVYADEVGGAGGLVTVDPSVVQSMGVRTAPVERMDFSREIRTVGKVEYNEETLHIVNTKVSGWIETLHVGFTGESVLKGEPLLEIYSPDLVTTQQEYLLALRNAERAAATGSAAAKRDADKLLQSTRERLLYWDVPQAEIDRLEQTREVRKTVLLKAPASGIVVSKTAVEGAYIRSGMDLFEIADLSTVWVHASVYDYELPWIEEGQAAMMELSYQPGRLFPGRLSYIYPYLRETARDVHARLIFANPDLTLKPGMYVNVRIEGRVIPNSLVIPTEAVIRSGERTLVFVSHSTGGFEPREITLGEEGGPGNAYVRVVSGLLEGESVVISAQFMLDSESRLQEAIQKMLQDRNGDKTPDGTETGAGAAEIKTEEMDHSGDQMEDSSSAPMQGMDHSGHQMEDMSGREMEGMDHGGRQMQDSSSAPMQGMDHSGHQMRGTEKDSTRIRPDEVGQNEQKRGNHD